jgi:hypothetical protein
MDQPCACATRSSRWADGDRARLPLPLVQRGGQPCGARAVGVLLVALGGDRLVHDRDPPLKRAIALIGGGDLGHQRHLRIAA